MTTPSSPAGLLHGGMGYLEESGAAQYLRDARTTTIYEGTTGIQANDLLGRTVARDGGRTIRALIGRIRGDAVRLHDMKVDPTLAVVSQALGDAVNALDESVTWIPENIAEYPERFAAGATDFLRLSGTVVAGWLHARLAEAALAQLRAKSQDTEYLSAKLFAGTSFRDPGPRCCDRVARHYAQRLVGGIDAERGAALSTNAGLWSFFRGARKCCLRGASGSIQG